MCINQDNELEGPFKEYIERNLSAAGIIFALYLTKLIDMNTFKEMKKIVTERNKLIHPGREGISYRYEKEETRAKQLLNQAINNIEKIK